MATFAQPERHMRLWLSGPPAWQRMVRPFVERPSLTRWLGLLAVAGGLWLASRQQSARTPAAGRRRLRSENKEKYRPRARLR